MTLNQIIQQYKDQIIQDNLVVLLQDPASDTGELQYSLLYQSVRKDGSIGIGHMYPPGYCCNVYPKMDDFVYVDSDTNQGLLQFRYKLGPIFWPEAYDKDGRLKAGQNA